MSNTKLILMRHGQSIYNLQNRFTGWTDVDLSEQGVHEAKEAGELLKKHQLYPNICFTSWLKRAIHTADFALEVLEWEHIDMIRSYKLNERHYGAWQGREKNKVKKEYGKEKFLVVRRGYDTPPPPLKYDDERCVWNETKYANINKTFLPLSESLKDTKKRVLEYYKEAIVPQLKKEKTVLISAHGNSLRALAMDLEKISEQDIVSFEIPTGEIIVYTFDYNMNIARKEIFL